MTPLIDGFLYGVVALLTFAAVVLWIAFRAFRNAQFEPCETCGGSGHTGTRVQREVVKT